jgi:hypothetical protein
MSHSLICDWLGKGTLNEQELSYGAKATVRERGTGKSQA